jgi:hypothetical protein
MKGLSSQKLAYRHPDSKPALALQGWRMALASSGQLMAIATMPVQAHSQAFAFATGGQPVRRNSL